jgi:hypothetical protein
LTHVLLRWQEKGLAIFEMNLAIKSGPVFLQVSKPWFFKSVLLRLGRLLMMRRSWTAGGFGGYVPTPTQRSGRFG